MGLILTTFLLISLISYILLMIGTIINEIVSPYKLNFFYTHWIVGRLTGLWELDVFVDTAIVAFIVGFLASLWVYKRLK